MLKSSKPSILPTKLILKIRPSTLNQREEDHVCKRTPITRETRKSDVVQKLDKHVSHTFSRALSVNLRVEADERELGRTRDELTASPLEPSSFFITQSGSYPIPRFLLSPERESRVFCLLVWNSQNSLSPFIVTKTL